MADKDVLASVFSSAITTSLSEQKAAPKKTKKKQCIVNKPSFAPSKPSASANGKKAVAPVTADQGWVDVKSSKSTPKSLGLKVGTQTHLPPKASKASVLATNAFYLPKTLEQKLHKAPSAIKPLKCSFEGIVETQVASQLTKTNTLTKIQRKHKLRSQKRAKKRADKEKAALLQQKPQALGLGKGTKEIKPVEGDNFEMDVESRSVETFVTAVSSEAETSIASEDCLLLSLPYDVLTNGVLSFLRPEEMSTLGACNKYAKEVSQAGFLWQSLFKQRFPSSQLTPTNMNEWKLAYQLSLTKIVDRLRCGTTQKTFMEDVIGVGVDFTENPKTGRVDYIQLSQDLLSETAFLKNTIRKDVFGNSFTLFLPLFFTSEHFKRALPQIQKTIVRLARNSKDGAFRRFHPNMVLDVFPRIVTTFVVLLSDNGIAACHKSYQGLIRIHRLFLALAQHYPEIQSEAFRRLKLFVSDEKYQTKAACPNLGAIVPLLMIVDDRVLGWPQICLPYMTETFDRMVLWACKKFPQLEVTHDAVSGQVESAAQGETRVALTLEAGHVSLRLVMFHVYFLKALCRGTVQDRANRYDYFFGQPEPKEMASVVAADDDNDDGVEADEDNDKPTTKEASGVDSTILFRHFREQVNLLMGVHTWQKFLAFVGLPCPNNKAEMARRLRCHVVNSRRKKYHTAGMNFARVQASGASRILAKGQEYSASSELRRVVFRDDWGFDGCTQYLDATCFLYEGKQHLETVDYCNTYGSYGAVVHSGDVMTPTTGSHTIHLNLDELDKKVTSCVFVLSAYGSATLADIKSPKISFSNAENEDGDPLCTYDLDSQDKVSYLTAVIMCRLYRVGNGAKQGWHVQAIGDAHKGSANNYGPMYEAVKKLL